MGHYLSGLTMGLAYVAPIGVQNLFVINAAMALPRRRAFISAWIVVFFDVSLALACFFGVGAVIDRVSWLRPALLLVGGVVVLAIGAGLLCAKERELSRETPPAGLAKTVSRACVVTWCNPQAILDGTLLLGAFHASLPGAAGSLFIAGVATASLLWFSFETLAVSLCAGRIGPSALRWIDRVCGAVIVFYALRLLLQFVRLFV